MKHVIIIVKYYLLQAGTEALIQEIPGLMHLKSYTGDEPRLTDIVLKHKPDVLIIHPDSLSAENTSLPHKIYAHQNTNLIAIVRKDEKDRVSSDFSTVLFMEETKSVLEKKLREIMNSAGPDENNHKELSKREIVILKNIALGLTHQEIADKLFISIHTVNTHRKNINKKLGIKTVPGLIVYALLNHLIQMDEIKDKD